MEVVIQTEEELYLEMEAAADPSEEVTDTAKAKKTYAVQLAQGPPNKFCGT